MPSDRPTGSPVLERITAAMKRWPLSPDAARPLAVAFSGGIDSTVLLAATASLGARLRALHVDHGLAPESAEWCRVCGAMAAQLGVPFEPVKLCLEEPGGGNLEARARAARYEALANLMQPGEVLLTAHHADDQLETLILRMARGAGVRGMRGIVEFDSFGPGYLARPLLDLRRADIEQAAREWDLTWIDDPSNEDARFDRNFLRNEVLPPLTRHWPAAPAAAVRLSRAMQDATEILDAMAVIDAARTPDPERVPCAVLRALPAARQRNLLRFLIRRLELPEPHSKHLEALLALIAAPARGASQRVQWAGAEGRIYREHLYLLAAQAGTGSASGPGLLSAAQSWVGSEGRVRLEPVAQGPGLPEEWARRGFELRFRHGGEMFRPSGKSHARPLKKWLQEAGIVPWMRGRVPLLLYGGRIAAVGDLWISEEALTARDGPGWRVVWEDHPKIR